MLNVYKGICEVEIKVEVSPSEKVNAKLTNLFEEINEKIKGLEIHFIRGEFTKE